MKVLIVDDSKTDVLMISSMLPDYERLSAYDGIEAMEVLRQHPDVDILVLDLNMPRMNGYEVLEAIRDNPEIKNIAPIILTNYGEIDSEIRGLELGAVDYIRKPLNIRSLRKRIELHAHLIAAKKILEQHNYALEREVAARTKESTLTRDATIRAMVSLLEVRNIESSNHTKRTQMMMSALCDYLKNIEPYSAILTEAYIHELCSTVPLHDIGKMGIPDHILLKPGKLTPDEFEVMKQHTTFGAEALKGEGGKNLNLSFICTAVELIETHHERFDGDGYPNGLSGMDIPLSGRLMAIVDVYDALVNERVYKPAIPHVQALEIIRGERGRQFDPSIVDAFMSIEQQMWEMQAHPFGQQAAGAIKEHI